MDDANEPRITLHPHSRRVRVVIDGTVLADTTRAIELRERGYPPQQYFPCDDVRIDLLSSSGTVTHCPFKGEASYLSFGEHENVAWSYERPPEDIWGLAERVAFFKGFNKKSSIWGVRKKVCSIAPQEVLAVSSAFFLFISILFFVFRDSIGVYGAVYFAFSGMVSFSASFSIDYWPAVRRVWDSYEGKWAFGLVALALATLGFILSNQIIFEVTGHAASSFPRAEAIMAFIMTALLWLMASYLMLLVIYFVYFFMLVRMVIHPILKPSTFRFFRYIRAVQGVGERKILGRDLVRVGAQFISLAVVILFFFGVFFKFVSQEPLVKNYSREIIRFSSFYSNAGRCPYADDDALVAPLRDQKAIVFSDSPPYLMVRCQPEL